MQNPAAPPRQHLTHAQVEALIKANSIAVDFGCELLDSTDTYITDISADLLGGLIERNNYRTVHATCVLQIGRQLQWGSQRLKPYMTISEHASGVEARFDLGVYVMSTPVDPDAGETPRTWEVEGFDKLAVLDTPIGETYRVAAGTAYLAAVATLIGLAGETKIRIDQASSAVTLPTDRVWVIDERNTYLHVINELLDSVGYRGLWVDESGYFRSESYQSPVNRASEWTYDTDAESTIVGEEREVDDGVDIDTPNRWVFMRDDPGQPIPGDGDGLYVVTNPADGPSSIAARGRTITARPCPIRLDAADHATLETLGDRYVEQAKQQQRTVRLRTGPNPLHGHFDVIRITDTTLGIDENFLSQSWVLPLNGDDMDHELKEVA